MALSLPRAASQDTIPEQVSERIHDPSLSRALVDTPVDPSSPSRFLELEKELHYILSVGIASLGPSQAVTPRAEVDELAACDQTESVEHGFDFSRVSIPKQRLVYYLSNWIVDCAPLLDKFDVEQHFAVQVPLIAQSSPPLLYAVLAFSARQSERKNGSKDCADSLEMYQTAITLLASTLQTRDRNVPVIATILACVELLSGRAQDWRRHVEGCAALYEIYGVNGFCGGVWQAVFWCFARMDLCGSIMSEGSQSTMLQLYHWVPSSFHGMNARERHRSVDDLFSARSHSCPDMHANWMVYLCARVCDLTHRSAQVWERKSTNENDTETLHQQWTALWHSLNRWRDERGLNMLPIEAATAPNDLPFPNIFFAHWPAISSNQLYHTACIMMLQLQPENSSFYLRKTVMPQWSAQWHARRVCGISVTNRHPASLVNAIQPLYIAGRLLSHLSEHLQIARILVEIERTTGWGALWRLVDLERIWGYERDEILQLLSDDTAPT